MNENGKKNNLWNDLTIGEKIGGLAYLIVSSLTLGLPDIVISLIMMPMALTTIYRHYEGFDRVTAGLKYVGRVALGILVLMITFDVMSWYVMFGDSDNADKLLKDSKNVAFVVADEVDWED